MEHLANEFGSRDRVNFHGVASDQEVLDFCARRDIFCMLGAAEPQSLVTLEAMAAGKPVVEADATAPLRLVHPTATATSSCPVSWAPLLTLSCSATRRRGARWARPVYRASPATTDTVRWRHSRPSASMPPVPRGHDGLPPPPSYLGDGKRAR
ncbi:glycosyltransferase [Streptomyces sp. NPDC002888]|uniref:glycosyltransferase n=1 Tax=Streptomyces sp. NPDC002888 TaxID=3364668 RepID=UPI00367C1283